MSHDAIPFLSSARQRIKALASNTPVEFSFQRPEHVDILAPLLAPYFPSTENAELGLRELMMNAIQHGNLEIGFDEKTALQQAFALAEEMERRLQRLEYASRCATITLVAGRDMISATIADSGHGFNWQPYMAIDERRLNLSHGRGIAIANMVCFDSVAYNDIGNAVKVVQRA